MVVAYGGEKGTHALDADRATIQAPTLALSMVYEDVPSLRSMTRIPVKEVKIFAFNDRRKDGAYVKPFNFPNVWDHGAICFGDLSPQNLREAYNTFWASTFNDDLGLRAVDTCEGTQHDYPSTHQGCICTGEAVEHKCSCSTETFHRHYGCGCYTVKASKKCRGSCGFRSYCACCLAIKTRRAELWTTLGRDLTKREESRAAVIDGEPYPGCYCTYRHKRGCPCGSYRCDCPCKCQCCTKTCSHDVSCLCWCCRGLCRCFCACCSMSDLLQRCLSSGGVRETDPWTNRADFFCGTKYLGSEGSVDAILISRSRDLLSRIPRQYHRSFNGSACIVALGHRLNQDDLWHFDGGSFAFQLRKGHLFSREDDL